MSKRCFWFETSEKSYCFDLGNVFLFLVEPQKRTGYYFVTISINSVNVTFAMLTGEGHMTHVNVKLYEIGVFQDIVNTLK